MQIACWVVAYEFTNNLIDADVAVSAPEELDALEQVTGHSPGSLRVGERQEGPRVSNERWEEGLKLTLQTTDGKHQMFRFLSMADLNGLILGTRTPRESLTREHAEAFGKALMARTTPMTVSMFDANVDLDHVQGVTGKPDGTLDGSELPISFVPRER